MTDLRLPVVRAFEDQACDPELQTREVFGVSFPLGSDDHLIEIGKAAVHFRLQLPKPVGGSIVTLPTKFPMTR